jgi:hypothetical protein
MSMHNSLAKGITIQEGQAKTVVTARQAVAISEVEKLAKEVHAKTGLSFIDMARAVLVGYEQLSFKPGQQVARIDGAPFTSGFMVETIKALTGEFAIFEGGTLEKPLEANMGKLRFASIDEVRNNLDARVFDSLKRNVGEFKQGDVVELYVKHRRTMDNNVYILRSSDDVNQAQEDYKAGKVSRFYPGDSIAIMHNAKSV